MRDERNMWRIPYNRTRVPDPTEMPLLAQLLGRELIAFQTANLRRAVKDRNILVTGAAGSIGSDLCRQAVKFQPRRLVAFDNAEGALFQLDQELRCSCRSLLFVPMIGDIRDARRVEEVLANNAFDTVFHAAAYKHVPMMESNPLEAIHTNVMGTWNLATASARHGVGRFVLISTDKAVRPRSVMGLTKRVSELLIAAKAQARASTTRFASVRFGNVLGSSGSVVPIFHEQIGRGGPLTVTHPEARRFFITAQEAVHFVLQVAAGVDGPGPFVLDMGHPVRIDELARVMIRSWGLEPDRDIAIHYTGLRAGEKLDEELINASERARQTCHPRIHVLHGPAISLPSIDEWIDRLRVLLDAREKSKSLACLAELVPKSESHRYAGSVGLAAVPQSGLSGAGGFSKHDPPEQRFLRTTASGNG